MGECLPTCMGAYSGGVSTFRALHVGGGGQHTHDSQHQPASQPYPA